MAKRRRSSTVSLLRVGAPSSVLNAPPAPVGAGGEKLKLITWGANDNLPQECLRIVYDSGTAEACATRIAQFIGGKGFASKATATMRANDEQTLNDILAEAKHYTGMGFGAAIVCRFTYGGQRGDVFVEPADCTRPEKGGLGRYVVNYGLAEGKRAAADNRVYLPYNPLASEEEIAEEVLAAVQSEAGYWGHLVWSFEARPGRTQCPVPSYYAGKEDLETDAALARFDKKQAANGFFPDAVMTVVGSKFAAYADPEFVPEAGQMADDAPDIESPDLAAVKAQVKQLKGSESDSSVMLMAVDTKDEIPDINFIDKGPNSKGLTDMRNRITGAVCRHMGVPPVLIGVAEPGMLGSNQQIVNSIKLFNLTVEPKRAEIIAPLAKLFPELTDWTVKPLSPVDYLDPIIAEKLTDDEIRAFGGYPELEKPQSTEAERTLQALAGLDALVANKVLEDLTEDERRALVGLGPKTTPKPVPAS
ncbi:hypothetical protein SAMN06265337_1919 [Hymenobacter gelipurpurascens]|uniref:Phage portal protein n=1 Tax=Hymenobacter gelipurpurascens TaxID=89968 RepID=A0A212TMX9_9BACT|nr:hypothetical protein [Hymenobacter gelipurpurascens]SNC67345.1 hypothetical protein SAMN06265337_1919 [Hymenobacter gelipurpurascens]